MLYKTRVDPDGQDAAATQETSRSMEVNGVVGYHPQRVRKGHILESVVSGL